VCVCLGVGERLTRNTLMAESGWARSFDRRACKQEEREKSFV